MNICPITYEPCDGRYSAQGLRRLSPKLSELVPLPYTAEELVHEAAARAHKMSIQGVQPKLSARLNVAEQRFEIVDTRGHFILKPQNPQYPQLPENEDLSMRLAEMTGLEVPLHGLVFSKDGSMTYFIKRFDRVGRSRKLAVEDFSQLMGLSRETKYDASMEKVASVVESFCTFPAIEKIKLFRMTLVSFLIGNEDMHLKNFSLVTRQGKVELSPVYDMLSTSIVLNPPLEEFALPLMGKKRKLDRSILVDYFAHERLGINERMISRVLSEIGKAVAEYRPLIDRSFLSPDLKQRYRSLIEERKSRILTG
jgi:serine/threonine-protein kinase HipA